MPNVLFEHDLFQPISWRNNDDGDEQQTYSVEGLLTHFALALDDTDPLQESFDCFCRFYELSQNDADLLTGILEEASLDDDNGGDGDGETNVRGFLSQLRTYPQSGSMRTFRNDDVARNFPINRYSVDGNDEVFSADHYKAFDRAHYGHQYTDFNNQPPTSRPLANPIINFAAVDSVGINNKMDWRILNTRTQKYETRKMQKEDAKKLAAAWNKECEQLDEAIENPNSSGQGYDANHIAHPLHTTCVKHGWKYSHSTPIHQSDGSTVIHHTWKRGDHNVGSYAGSEHWTSHRGGSAHLTHGHGAAALDKYLIGKVRRGGMNENQIASTPITENLLRPLSQRHLEAINAVMDHHSWTMAGSVSQSDATINPAAEFRKTQQLINERKAKFGEDKEPSEQDAINARSNKALRKN